MPGTMRSKATFLAIGAGIAGALFWLSSTLCTSSPIGSVTVAKGELSDAYLLIAPYRIDVVPGETPLRGTVHLISRKGAVVHTWQTEAPVLVARLESDGTLYVSMTPAIDHRDYPGFGTTGIIQQLDWDGEVLWEHRDPLMTLDFDVLPGGSVAYLRWEHASARFAAGVKGGFSTATSSVWANDIVVVDREKKESWVWHMSSHLEPGAYEIDASVARQEFSHANSLRYVATNPVTGRPAYLMSVRHLNKVLLIDAENGAVVWESPDGLLALQHDATLLPNGNVLLFDNGFARAGIAALLSRVIEIAPNSGEVVWQYDGGMSMTGKAQFASSIMGGAQRLSNGNTLITLSATGTVLEVTPEGDVVWEYRSTGRDANGELPILFRAHLYEPEGTAWANKLGARQFLSCGG